jgi:hypothetical protein
MRIGLAGGAELYAQTMPLAYVRKLFFLQFSDPSHALFSVPLSSRIGWNTHTFESPRFA